MWVWQLLSVGDGDPRVMFYCSTGHCCRGDGRLGDCASHTSLQLCSK